jgi:hypothetical protein
MMVEGSITGGEFLHTSRTILKEDSDLWSIAVDDQWRYSPDRALASLYGFHDSFIVRCGVISSTIDLF